MVYTNQDSLSVEQFSFIFDGTGLQKGKKVKLFELSFSGNPESCAVSISKRETELYHSLHLKGKIYTLFMGPMEYSNGVMRVRLGIAVGIHRR